MTVPQPPSPEQDRAARWVEIVTREIVSVLKENLVSVHLNEPRIAEFATIERSVQSLLRTVGGILATD